MRYLLVDRILEWQANKGIKGIKNIAMSEDYLEFHFPNRPVMPGVMLLEALTQLAGWLTAASTDFKKWFLLSQVNQCKFYSFALPGDHVVLTIEKVDNEGSTFFRGIGVVEDKKKISADFCGELIDIDRIEDIEHYRRTFQTLTRELKWR
jgi:3-hydroxyacyl-[acyl-carrier-protein] dehydratase